MIPVGEIRAAGRDVRVGRYGVTPHCVYAMFAGGGLTWFEAQAKQRQGNLEKRKTVLERLRNFENQQSAEHPDFRAVAAVLREAPQEWRRHFPVERAVARELQKEFDAALGRLQGRLEAWHAGNTEGKRLLIRRAAGLVDLQDGREATEAVKRLQAQWKELGAAAPDQERVLWEEFRGH